MGPLLIGFFLTRPPFMLSHPTISLNMKAWLIRHNLRPQTLTWAGVDPLTADINLTPFLSLSLSLYRVHLVILRGVLPTFLTSRFFVWSNHCNSISAHLSVCLFNKIQAIPPGVYRSNVRLAFALYRPIEENILDNLSIKTSCELKVRHRVNRRELVTEGNLDRCRCLSNDSRYREGQNENYEMWNFQRGALQYCGILGRKHWRE
jgi:hypothetical protein